MTFDAKLDLPFDGPLPGPDFAEAQQWNFTDGKYGVIYHIGSMPGDLKLWHNAFAVTCPDGTALASKIIGRGPLDRFGSHSANSITMEPYEAWEVHFDGALRRYQPNELQLAPGRDGRHIPVKVDLKISARHPVWDPGAGSTEHEGSIFQTFCKMHHEQALTAKGVIEIDGERIDFEGVGHRDHSFGPREFGTLLRGFWINGTFESGWSFLAFEGQREGSDNVRKGAIFENGQIIECDFSHEAELHSTAPDPQTFVMKARLSDGTQRDIRVSCKNGVNWTADGPTEWCVGSDISKPRNYVFTHYFADVECDGEAGFGFADRGARADLLKHP